MKRRILPPHKRQDGYHYIRVECCGKEEGNQVYGYSPYPENDETWYPVELMTYDDGWPSQRIISSRRVEEAIEIVDYLKLCAKDGLFATYDELLSGAPSRRVVGLGAWGVSTNDRSRIGRGKTLKEAYWRCKNAGAS